MEVAEAATEAAKEVATEVAEEETAEVVTPLTKNKSLIKSSINIGRKVASKNMVSLA